jgi:DNA-binding transcriptional LysR family regulator
LTLTQLHQFVTLSRIGSFIKASAALHITQPALSRSVKSLEDEFGQLLFDRIGKRIELTAFGRQTLEHALALLEDANRLRTSGAAISATSSGRLRVGLSSGPGVMLTHPVLQHFAHHFPNVHVDIYRANTLSLARMLREREVDAIVVDVRSLNPSPDFQIGKVYEMHAGFMCRSKHPLLRHARVSLEQISQYPVASNPLSDEVARLLVQRYGQAAHPHTLVKLSSDEISHLAQVCADSNTVLLAIRAAAPQLHELRLSPAFNIKAHFAMVTIVKRAESTYLPILRDIVQETLK